MRRIATLLGVAPNALYSHVDDRDAIVIAVLDRELAGVGIPDTGTTQDRLELTCRALWNRLVNRPGLAAQVQAHSTASAELARLRRELGDLLRLASPHGSAIHDVTAVLLSFTIGSAALRASATLLTAERTFRLGLGLLIPSLELHPAPGRFTVAEWPVVEDTVPVRDVRAARPH